MPPSLPPRPWTTLVPPEALLPEIGSESIVLLDCRHKLDDPEAGPRAYDDGHILGAHHAHIDRDLSGPVGPTTGRHPLPDPDRFRRAASRWGVAPHAQVVAYDDVGGAFAARAWWLLRHHGHDAVAVLDGGLQAYISAGGRLTREMPTRYAEDTFHSGPGHLPTVDAKSIAARLPAAPGTLIDVRDPTRYRGDEEPIDPVAGHIPGARNKPFKSHLDRDGRFLPSDRLRADYQTLLADRKPDEVAFYCGSGVTATHGILALEVAGLYGAALYPGSWSEWCSDRERPVATGEEEVRA